MHDAETLKRNCEEFYEACNSGEVARMTPYLSPDAVHYFPAGGSISILHGAEAIAAAWRDAVLNHGSRWTLDHVIVDAERGEAALEWTHWKTNYGGHVRGGEFYLFDHEGKITELRAYYAAPATDTRERYELALFEYGQRGYSTSAP
jgi:hypothetical protein